MLTTQTNSILVTPGNIKDIAHLLDSGVSTTKNVIRFGPGKGNAPILEFPILRTTRGGGPLTTIRITVGMKKPSLRANHDPRIGITDGTTVNQFWVSDLENYDKYPPCDAANAENAINGGVPHAGRYPSQVTFMFAPYEGFGICSAAQDSGIFVNTATFHNNLDLFRNISLQVMRHKEEESYEFFYFLVEVFDN